jgi:hypothetical protein
VGVDSAIIRLGFLVWLWSRFRNCPRSPIPI